MTIFDGLASRYDAGMRPLEWLFFRRLRRQIFPLLTGHVLELGLGTGINLPLYGTEAQVTGCDTSAEMLACAADRSTQAYVRLAQADVQHLPFAESSFDIVTASLLFCSVVDPAQGLSEVRRVLRPGGRLVLLEHQRGLGVGAWLTELLHPVWYAGNGVCHLNRETAQAVDEAGFRIERVDRYVLGIVRVIDAVR